MEHKIIRTRTVANGWGRQCVTCNHEFEAGEDRHEWRMYLLYKEQGQYRKNGYWVTSCHECFVKNMVTLADNIMKEIDSMPQCMRDLV